MSDGLQVALGVAAIVLFALVVGALLPVLFEARATLRAARRLLDDGGQRFIKTMDETSKVMVTLDRIVEDVEPRVQALAHSLDEAQRFLKTAIAVGAAVGPAVAAAFRGYQAGNNKEG